MDYAILIPNWNGADLLPKALSALEPAMRDYGRPGKVLVVDDASEDDSLARARERFPDVDFLQNPVNLGFAGAVNRGLAALDSEVIVLLNNDIVVRPDFLGHVLAPFHNRLPADLFAVSARTVQWDSGRPSHVRMNGRWRRGWLDLDWADPAGPEPTLFVQGGACAVRRSAMARLGGLRELYRPGYWEDYDLSYRAAKRGWPSLYAPAAVAYHLGQASFEGRYGADGVQALRRRNELLFLWANLDNPAMIRAHGVALVRRTVGEMAAGRWDSLKALLQALPRLPEVIRARRQGRGAPGRSVVDDGALLPPPQG